MVVLPPNDAILTCDALTPRFTPVVAAPSAILNVAAGVKIRAVDVPAKEATSSVPASLV